MEVNLTPATAAQLQQFAARKGKNVEQIVEETITKMLEQQARFVRGVERGISQAERGELIEHDEVVAHINRLLKA